MTYEYRKATRCTATIAIAANRVAALPRCGTGSVHECVCVDGHDRHRCACGSTWPIVHDDDTQ